MSYTCRACGEQATLTACEHCGGQGRSQSAIAEIARLRAELATRDAAIAALKQAVETKDRAHAAAIDREFAAIKRLRLAEVVIDALGGVLCIPVYKGRECFFGYYSAFDLGHASAESIDKLNAAYAAWQANKEQA